MKVKMKIWISGTRNGVPWPAPGETVELPDIEAAKMCANGSATPVAEDDVEKAVPEAAEERLTTRTGPVRKSRK